VCTFYSFLDCSDRLDRKGNSFLHLGSKRLRMLSTSAGNAAACDWPYFSHCDQMRAGLNTRTENREVVSIFASKQLCGHTRSGCGANCCNCGSIHHCQEFARLGAEKQHGSLM